MKLNYSLRNLLIAMSISITPVAIANDHQGMDMDMKMDMGQHTSDQQGSATSEGMGIIRSFGSNGGSVVLAHEPMADIGWPAMVMEFALAEPDLAQGLAEDSKVQFTLREMEQAGVYEIVEIATVE